MIGQSSLYKCELTDQCCLVPTIRNQDLSWLLGPSGPLRFGKATSTGLFLGYPVARGFTHRLTSKY